MDVEIFSVQLNPLGTRLFFCDFFLNQYFGKGQLYKVVHVMNITKLVIKKLLTNQCQMKQSSTMVKWKPLCGV